MNTVQWGVASGAPILTEGAQAEADALDELELRAWRGFTITHARVVRRLETELLGRGGISGAEFDVLLELSLAPDRQLRMSELADRVALSRPGITRLIDRLVGQKLVDRCKCASDARGAYAVLTNLGFERVEALRPTHQATVRRHFLCAYSDEELATIADLMGRERTLI
jgi:DNA-binding MarR family transcriptional regulator